MNIETSATFLLTQIAISFRNYLQKLMNEINLHGGQIFVLLSLWNTDGQTQTDLVKNLSLTAPTVNKMIGSLMRNGFVECQRCGKDGRMVRVYLTDKGRRAKSPAEEQWLKLEAQTFANLTETEKLIFLQLLNKLKENFGKNLAPAANDL